MPATRRGVVDKDKPRLALDVTDDTHLWIQLLDGARSVQSSRREGSYHVSKLSGESTTSAVVKFLQQA